MYRTLSTADLLDDLTAAVDQARTVQMSDRWRNALESGYEYLLQTDEIVFDVATGTLVYYSESGVIYQANGSCQCKAFEEGQPCKHRAAARLVKNAVKAQANREMSELFAA